MSELGAQAHTVATSYLRQLQKAQDDLAQTAKYLDPQSPNYLQLIFKI